MRTYVLGAAVFVVLASIAARAHHSPAALYLLDKQIVVEGVVTEYRFVNPHARIYLDVTTGGGQVEKWLAEGGSPLVLRRQGWNGQEVKPGDRVKIAGNPARDASKLIHWLTVTLPNGSELFGEDLDFGAVDKRRRQQQN
jgi:Family of unknown function (DUF6152)